MTKETKKVMSNKEFMIGAFVPFYWRTNFKNEEVILSNSQLNKLYIINFIIYGLLALFWYFGELIVAQANNTNVSAISQIVLITFVIIGSIFQTNIQKNNLRKEVNKKFKNIAIIGLILFIIAIYMWIFVNK